MDLHSAYYYTNHIGAASSMIIRLMKSSVETVGAFITIGTLELYVITLCWNLYRTFG